MSRSGIQNVTLRQLQAVVYLAQNKFIVNLAADDLEINPKNFSILITRMIKKIDVELFTYCSNTVEKRSKINGFTDPGYDFLKSSINLLNSLNLLKNKDPMWICLPRELMRYVK